MKLSNYAIPYPVLGIEGMYNKDSIVEYSFAMTPSMETYTFFIEYKMNDDMILDLVKKGLANFCCEVDCAKTYYRKVFKCDKATFEVEIPKTSLVGNVLFFFSVVLAKDIPNYKNPNFNQKFYSGYSFNLKAGDMLAYFGERTFNADIKYNELKAIGSILEVLEDTKESYTHYNLESDKIRIFLPTEEYKNFKRSNNKTYSDFTHASIVQCALINALYNYKANKTTTWAQTLKLRTQTEPKLAKFKELEELDSNLISEMVDIILNNPNKRMLDKLSELNQ